MKSYDFQKNAPVHFIDQTPIFEGIRKIEKSWIQPIFFVKVTW